MDWSLGHPPAKLCPSFVLKNRRLSTLLCNHPFAVLKLLQPHLLILATMGLQFILSFCELPKARINPWASLSLRDQKGQTAYAPSPIKKNQRRKDLASFCPLHISRVTKGVTSIKNSHSSIAQEIHQVLTDLRFQGGLLVRHPRVRSVGIDIYGSGQAMAW